MNYLHLSYNKYSSITIPTLEDPSAICLYDGEKEKEVIGTPMLHCSITLQSSDLVSTSRSVPS